MTINLSDFLLAQLFIALIVLVIVLIILGIRMIRIVSKVERTIDDVNNKLSQTSGIFNVAEKAGDFVDGVSDKIIMAITNLIGRFVNRKKGNDIDE